MAVSIEFKSRTVSFGEKSELEFRCAGSVTVGQGLLQTEPSRAMVLNLWVTIRKHIFPVVLRIPNHSQAVMVHAFNPSTWEAEAGRSL